MARILLFVMLGLGTILIGMRFMPGGDRHKTAPAVAKVDPLAPAPQPAMDEPPTDAASIVPAVEPPAEPVRPAAGPVAGPVIPAAFRGEWNADRARCGTGRGETRLVIGPDWVQFYESSGDVSAVRRQDDRIATIVATFTGEGQTFDRTIRMTLSPSGADLTIDGLARHRCPENRADPAPRP